MQPSAPVVTRCGIHQFTLDQEEKIGDLNRSYSLLLE